MKKTHSIMIFLLLSIFMMTSCKTSKEVKIGFSGSLTGLSSELGTAARNGFLLAIDEINESGYLDGVKLVPVIKDDKSDPKEALNAGREFSKEDVHLLVGFMTSNMTDSVITLMEDEGLLFISPTMSTINLSDKDDNFFRVVSAHDEQAYLLNDLLEFKAIDSVAILYDSSNAPYTVPIYNLFKDTYLGNSGNVLYEDSFETSDLDPSQVADEIIRSSSKGVVVIANSIDSSKILQQLRKKGSDIPAFLAGWAMTNDLISHGGQSVEGAYVASAFESDNQSPKYLKFIEDYESRYKESPSFSSSFAYECVYVLADAIKESGSSDPEDIKSSIVQLKTFKGLQSDFTINEYGDPERQTFMFQVKDGQFKRVK